jgi:hypothetical protein
MFSTILNEKHEIHWDICDVYKKNWRAKFRLTIIIVFVKLLRSSDLKKT